MNDSWRMRTRGYKAPPEAEVAYYHCMSRAVNREWLFKGCIPPPFAPGITPLTPPLREAVGAERLRAPRVLAGWLVAVRSPYRR